MAAITINPPTTAAQNQNWDIKCIKSFPIGYLSRNVWMAGAATINEKIRRQPTIRVSAALSAIIEPKTEVKEFFLVVEM